MVEKADDVEILTVNDEKDSKATDDKKEEQEAPLSKQERTDSKDDSEILISAPVKTGPFNYARLFLVEIFIFFFTFGMSARLISTQALYLNKICVYSLNNPLSLCQNLTDNPTVQNNVQQMASLYNLYGNLIQMIPSAALAMFIGPWSDKYGRKLPIILALSGIILQELGLLLNSIFIQADLTFTLLCFIPAGLFGGIITIVGSLYSYASEQTPSEGRTFKFAVLELCFGLGMALGAFTAGQLLPTLGKDVIFSTSVAVHSICLLMVVLLFKDSGVGEPSSGWYQKAVDLFSLESIKENVKATLRERENRGRTQIWLLIGSVAVNMSYIISLTELSFYFCNKMYNWNVPKFTVVSTVSSVITILMMTAAVPLFTRVLRFSDPLIGLLGAVSILAQSLLKAFAYQEAIYYIALGVGIFGAFTALAGRSRISKLVDKDELGKVFSILAAFESVLPIIASTVFTLIYTASLDSFAGLVFLVAAIFLVFPVVVFVWLIRITKVPYSKVANAERLRSVTEEVNHGL